jgi:protein-disulfide isomerase
VLSRQDRVGKWFLVRWGHEVTGETDTRRSSRKEAEPERGSSSRAVNLRLSFSISLFAAIAVVAAAASMGCGSTQGTQPTPGNQTTPGTQGTPTAEPTPKTIEIDVGDNPSKGPADAKVTIVEFADFQGPHCATFAQQTLPQILANYGDTIRFVFMNGIVTSTNSYAEQAAEAGECANAQGSFWPYHDLLFQNQQALIDLINADQTAGLAKVVDSLKGYAAQLGLDTAKFNDCLDSGSMASAVAADMQTARKAIQDAGLTSFRGVPSFFINGNYLLGAQPYDVFKQAIDAALAAAK